jgi:hypothetical protein
MAKKVVPEQEKLDYMIAKMADRCSKQFVDDVLRVADEMGVADPHAFLAAATAAELKSRQYMKAWRREFTRHATGDGPAVPAETSTVVQTILQAVSKKVGMSLATSHRMKMRRGRARCSTAAGGGERRDERG